MLANLCARTIPRLPAPHQGLARLVDQGLHLFLADAQHRRNVGVRVVAELEQHERGTLVQGQPLQVVQQLAELLPPLDLVRQPVEVRSVERSFVGRDVVATSPQLGQAPVASDRVEPRTQGDVALAAP